MSMRKQKPSSDLATGFSPAETSVFDTFASDYDEWFEKDGKLIFAIEVQAFHEILASLPGPWVEIGVGSGRFAKALGIEIGLDPSANLLKMARKRGITTFLGRAEHQPFDTASVGTAFIILTFCFLRSPLEALRETFRVLKPEGKIVLGLVTKENPWGKFYEQEKKNGHRFYKKVTFYKFSEITTILGQSGFSIGQVLSTLFQEPGKVLYLESPKSGYSRDAGFVIIVAGKMPRKGSVR